MVEGPTQVSLPSCIRRSKRQVTKVSRPLAVPVLIAALIIANTMLGSVFERTKEIGIYSSIGLAPIHIGALFIAEAMVYAVLGSISGYLIAQIVAKIITATNLLPGITLNYSSSSAVLATLIVMLTVLLSTVYPAWMASRISSPEGNKKRFGRAEWATCGACNSRSPFRARSRSEWAQFLADFFRVAHRYFGRQVFHRQKCSLAVYLCTKP